jgi:hypothetical protein
MPSSLINAVDALGYINRKSSRWWSLIGAFMTANLLTF